MPHATTAARRLAGLATLLLAGAAAAQPTPAADPAADLFNAPLPDWVQPGARLVYDSQTAGTGGANTGRVAYDILDVRPDGVLVQSIALSRLSGSPTLHLAGGAPIFFNHLQINAGGAPFAPPQALAAMTSGGAVSVARGESPTHPGTDAVLITIASRDRTVHQDPSQPRITGRETSQSSTEMTFEPNSGIKLHELIRAADSSSIRDQNNRPVLAHTTVATGSLETLVQYRQTPTPWRDQQWPQWTQAVEEITYAGVVRNTQVGIELPQRQIYRIQAREPGLVTGQITTQNHDVNTGQLRDDPTTSPFVVSQHSAGLWIAPESLANAPVGTLDHDPNLTMTVTFTRDDTTATLVTAFDSGDRVTSVYDLQSGLMIRSETVMAELGYVIERELESYR